MASIVETSQPATEPVDLATAYSFLHQVPGTDDPLLQNVIIPGARRQLESSLGLTLANRDFVQYEDGFPFSPYLNGAAFPFSFGYGLTASYPFFPSIGLHHPTLNLFEKKLLRSPVTAVRGISYVGTDGKSHGLLPGKDFSVDFASLPGRLTPLPGQRWPAGVMGNSTVAIYFSAGYLPPDSGNSDESVGAVWAALNKVAQFSYVFDANGNVQLQTVSGGITGIVEPTWAAIGASVSESPIGKANWKNLGPITGAWAAAHSYVAPVVILDPSGNLQQLNVSSLTSGGTIPNFASNRGQIMPDNSVAAWMCIGADQSQGAGDTPFQVTEYQGDNSIPPNLFMALCQLITHWYQQRSVIVTVAGAGGTHLPLPLHLEEIIASERVLDFGRSK